MPSKTEEYLALAQRTANGLTRYWESWTDYLTTASRLYKYPFADQLMIYAQRPDATACADFDIWNNRMNRYVPRSATQLDAGKRGLNMNFDHEELTLMMLYNTGTRLGLVHELRLLQDYDAVMDKVAEAEELSADHRPSTLEKLAELASDTSTPKSSARSAPEL